MANEILTATAKAVARTLQYQLARNRLDPQPSSRFSKSQSATMSCTTIDLPSTIA